MPNQNPQVIYDHFRSISFAFLSNYVANLSFIKNHKFEASDDSRKGHSLFPAAFCTFCRAMEDVRQHPNRFSVYRIAYEIALVESGAFRHIRRHRTRCTTATNTAPNIAGRTNSHVARLYGSGSSADASSPEGTTSFQISPTGLQNNDSLSASISGHGSGVTTRFAWKRTDPISLSILLDTGGAAADLLPEDRRCQSPHLRHHLLSTRDRVLDLCDGLRFDSIAQRHSRRKRAVKTQGRCGIEAIHRRFANRTITLRLAKQSVPLWDSLGFVATELSKLPGRRVILE